MTQVINTNFKVTDHGLITFRGKRIAYRRNGELLILADARSNFGLDDHVMFDALIATDTNRRYINSFEAEFDWKARFTEFKSGKLPAGVAFTPIELAAVEALASAEAKIKAAFGLPEIPYQNAAAIDVKKIYGEDAEAARAWLDGGKSTYSIERVASRSQATNDLVRIRTNGNANSVQLLSGRTLGEKTAKKIWPKLKAAWAEVDTGTRNSVWVTGSIQGYTANAFKTYFKIGCQEIPRAEIERIAALRGWDATAPA